MATSHKMMSIDFDLEPKMDPTIANARATKAEENMKRTLVNVNNEDDFKGYQALRSACKHEDYYNSGTITKEQLGKIMSRSGAYEEPQVIQIVFDRYDVKGEKKINIDRFCDGIFGRKQPPTKQKDVCNVLASARQAILSRGVTCMASLASTFRHMDTNQNGILERDELHAGLRKFGLDLTDAQIDTVFKGFSSTSANTIDLTEFLVALRGPMSERREKLVTLAFNQLKPSRSGVVAFSDICAIYDASRHPDVIAKRRNQEDVLREFITSWDLNGDGDITMDEFLEYYKGISSSIDNDDFFELMIRNAWHLAGGKGTAANTSNLRVFVVRGDGSEDIVAIENDLGLDKRNIGQLKKRLHDQGETDVAEVRLCL